MALDCIFLDCDGVIFRSNHLKLKAFKETLAPIVASEELDEIIKRVSGLFGRTRIEIFNILNSEYKLKPNNIEEVIEEYSRRCVELYMHAEIVPGVIEFVENEAPKRPIYIVSGSDQKELREAFYNRKLDHLFAGIFGSPIKKSEHIKKIMMDNNLKQCRLYGDSSSDFNAARLNEIDFVFVSETSLEVEKVRELISDTKFQEVVNFEGLGELSE